MSAFSNNIFDLLNEDGYKPAPVAAPAKEANKPTTEAKPASNDKRGKSNGGNSRPFIPLFYHSSMHATLFSLLYVVPVNATFCHPSSCSSNVETAICWQRGKTEIRETTCSVSCEWIC